MSLRLRRAGWSHRQRQAMVQAVVQYVESDILFDQAFDARAWPLVDIADDERKLAVKEFYRIVGVTPYES